MNLADQTGSLAADRSPEALIRAQFAREERVRAAVGTVLPHLVGDDDSAPLGEEPVIRTRALLAALAADLLREQADAGRQGLVQALAQALATRSALLTHCHALALEAATAERLAPAGIDPVLSPLIETLLAVPDAAAPDSADYNTAALAMTALAAQARFTCRQRRMDAVANELPAILMHEALVALADLPGGPGDDAVAALRATYDEGRSRLSLLARLALAAADHAEALLDPVQAGFALFATALAERAGAPREEVVLAGAPGQELRLALLLRAAGAAAPAARAALAAIHPLARLPTTWDDLPAARASALLAGAPA